MKKITVLLISLFVSGLIYAQHIPSHEVVFKLYFKDKQIDAAGYKFFEFLTLKEKKTELNGDPLDIRFEDECKCVVYTSYDDSIKPALTIIHDIDTMKITFPAGFVYVDKIPFNKAKYILLGDVPDRKSTRLNSSHLGISYAVF